MNDIPKQTNACKLLSTAEMMHLVCTKGLGPAIAIIGEHLDKRATMPKNVPNSVMEKMLILINTLKSNNASSLRGLHNKKIAKIEITASIYDSISNPAIPLINHLALFGYLEFKKTSLNKTNTHRMNHYLFTKRGIELFKMLETFSVI